MSWKESVMGLIDGAANREEITDETLEVLRSVKEGVNRMETPEETADREMEATRRAEAAELEVSAWKEKYRQRFLDVAEKSVQVPATPAGDEKPSASEITIEDVLKKEG